jgi:putative membrane protein
MRLIARLLVIAAAVWIVAAVVPGVHVQDGITSYLIIAVIFAVVNVLVRPVLLLFSLPFLVITLGLFLLVVNAALLGITAALTSRLSIDGFGSAVVAALLITMVTWAGDNALGLKKN